MNNSKCIELLCNNNTVNNQKYCVDCIYCINCNKYRNDENILCENCENAFDEINDDDIDDYVNNYNNVTNKKNQCIAPFCENFTTNEINYCKIHYNCATCDNKRMENKIFCNTCLYI